MTEATALFEAEHVHAVYDGIAADFSRTRHSPWPFVRHFLDALPSASLVLDAGTGNGKYLGTRSVLDYAGKHDPPPTARRRRAQPEPPETPRPRNGDMLAIGFDMSNGLLSIASERGHEVVRGDCVDLSCWRRGAFVRFPSLFFALPPFPFPVAHNLFPQDHAISIATIHHFATPERRIESIKVGLPFLSPPGSCPSEIDTLRAQQMILAVLPPTPPPSSSSNPNQLRSRILIVVWSLEQDPALVADDRSARRTRGGKQGAVPAPPPLASASASSGDNKARRTLEEEGEGANVGVQDVFVPWARQNQIPRQQKATPTGRVSSNGAGGSPSSSSGASASASASAKKQLSSVPERSEREQSPSSSSKKGGALQKVPPAGMGAVTESSQQPEEHTPETEAATAPAPSPTPTPTSAPTPAKAEPGNSSEAATTTETDKTETTQTPTFNRYYHLFRQYELSSLVQSAASQLGLAFSYPDGYPLFPPSSSNPSSSSSEEAKYTKEGGVGWEARVRLCEERWERENWVVELEVGWSPESGESDQGHGHGHGHGHAGAAAPPPEVASHSAE